MQRPDGLDRRGNTEVIGDLLMVLVAVIAAILVTLLVLDLAFDTIDMLEGVVDAIRNA